MYYSLKINDVYRQLDSSDSGLTDNKASQRQNKYGKNKLVSKRKANHFLMFLQEFTSPLVIILMLAALISLGVALWEQNGEFIDPIAIFTILIINAFIGFIQEFKAEKSVEALKNMMSPRAKVLRNGRSIEVLAEDLVPGDIILLEEGDKVPADARVIESINLETDEAALTGESTTVAKTIAQMADKKLVPALQKNMVFMGTLVTKGRGRAIVIGIGMDTEFGKIANLTQEMQAEDSPLQKELTKSGQFIGQAVLVISLIIFGIGLFNNGFTFENILEQFKFAIVVAVAAIPQGLPVTLTIALALGVQRMAKRKAIVRKLQSVETLGSTRIICSDKTGTLTKNQMTVRKIWTGKNFVTVSGSGYLKEGKFSGKFNKKDLNLLLTVGLQANDSQDSGNQYLGDPTEIALLVSAQKASLKRSGKRLAENPFDSVRKLMSVLVKDKESVVYVKGAPSEILKKCTHIQINGIKKKLTPALKKEINKAEDLMADEALRVLGFAYKKSSTKKNMESGLVFVGLQGMIDPPRDEVKQAVVETKKAGINIVIITGDAKRTAKAIATELGIADKNTPVFEGSELDSIKDATLYGLISKGCVIFARVTPEHKLRVVNLLKDQGEIVAVTGDGVNDAPALKRADIGVAMGITGTEVSKEASEVILADDSFATIVYAIREGRTIYANIKKFLRYMFSSNLGELWTIIFGMVFLSGTHIVSAIQVLWINIATDMAPALSLGVEPVESNIMDQKPRDPRKRIITKRNFLDWLVMGFIMGLGTVITYVYYTNNEPLKAGTMAFTMLVGYQLVNVVNCRSDTQSVFKLGFFSNPWIWLSIILGVGLQLILIYVPFFEQIFETVALNIKDWIIIITGSLSILVYDEIRKAIIRHRNK